MSTHGHRFAEYLHGEFINLRKVLHSDAKFIYNLRTSDAGKCLNHPDGYDLSAQEAWIDSRTEDEINYIIMDGVDEETVGMISIYDCDWHNLVSNCGRLLIKDKYIKSGSPYGLDALKLCYGYIFDVMEFRKITGTIRGDNQKIINLQTHLGMTQEGVLKDHVVTEYGLKDLYIFSLFNEDFDYYQKRIDLLLDKYRT